MNQILVGSMTEPLMTFDNSSISVVRGLFNASLSGDELAYDQLFSTVYSTAHVRVGFAPSDYDGFETSDGDIFVVKSGNMAVDSIPYGTPLFFVSDGELVAKFYMQRVRRVGTVWFDITAVSALGIMDGQIHEGGIYNGTRFDDLIADIIGGAFSFSVTPELAALPVFGWLPYQSKRKNIHQAVIAMGALISKDENGDMVFGFPATGSIKNIQDGNIFLGGNIDWRSPASAVEVTEHSFLALPDDDSRVLYDNSDGSAGDDPQTVVFVDAPIHDLTTTGTLTIVESGVNYAIVQGVGSLSGQRYTHDTRVVNASVVGAAEQNVVRVTDAYLVSLANSKTVSKRLMKYFSAARTVSADIILDGEKPGDQIAFTDPFMEPSSGYISSMTVNASSFLRANCEIVANYSPSDYGNNYSNVLVLTGSGTIPGEIVGKSGLAVLVGGGDGGLAGENGENGSNGTSSSNGMGGEGGAGGDGGLGGRVLTREVTFTAGMIYSCGIGGEAGLSGMDTIFGSLTTATGQRSPGGVANLFTGEILGGTGEDGVAGGNGAQADAVYLGVDQRLILAGGTAGTSISHERQTYEPGADGESATYVFNAAGGGGGGGPAFGTNGAGGEAGQAFNLDHPSVGSDSDIYTFGGDGGGGANATAPAAETTPGKGGRGGNGGGGGGGGGGAGYYGVSYGIFSNGSGGAGGLGTDGSKGGDGAIIIYY